MLLESNIYTKAISSQNYLKYILVFELSADTLCVCVCARVCG